MLLFSPVFGVLLFTDVVMYCVSVYVGLTFVIFSSVLASVLQFVDTFSTVVASVLEVVGTCSTVVVS